jgi:hypothetical protein
MHGDTHQAKDSRNKSIFKKNRLNQSPPLSQRLLLTNCLHQSGWLLLIYHW